MLTELVPYIRKTFLYDKVGLDIGYFANVIDVGEGMGIALSADGVGTKVLVAQMLNKYDTIGIDCVAMNVNDLLCVGAEPITMLDYIVVSRSNPLLVREIGKGLREGAEIARISISGGETAIMENVITGERAGYEFDLAGMAVGKVSLDKLIVGSTVQDGDVIIGLQSNGIHSNGFTLARRILERNHISIDEHFEEFDGSIGEELLKPTHIYVPEIMEMIRSGLDVKALIHITGGGLLNLGRIKADVSFKISNFPEPPPIFKLLQRLGKVPIEEMFRIFNMGIGFCIIASKTEEERIIEIAGKHKVNAYNIGNVIKGGGRRVYLTEEFITR